MPTHNLTCREAKQKDLIEYLASLGYQPKKIQGPDHWYLSPFREEKTPSFKVNKQFNIWYDHGIGKGGNLIDFGILYHQCTVAELLQKLNSPFPFQQLPNAPTTEAKNNGEKEATEEKNKIRILSEKEMQSPALIDYLAIRNIPLYLGRQYCRQVDFELYGKTHTALGFPNRSGGYELRNGNFKGSSSPKDISFINNGREQVAVFEGFFSFLSSQVINLRQDPALTNFLVLNSLAFLEKSRELMEQHERIHLYLDWDPAGIRATEKAERWSSKYLDRSEFYSPHKDFNEWLQADRQILIQQHRRGRHL
jgi:hypothetical protein